MYKLIIACFAMTASPATSLKTATITAIPVQYAVLQSNPTDCNFRCRGIQHWNAPQREDAQQRATRYEDYRHDRDGDRYYNRYDNQ